ncbi:DNRLRE domain-containing protein [Peribacillus asahii]|uniref:DNRLRE domain-containing protein n=1 Tax=Peribacillus asahii TaxID=228899 RepID=UPI0020799B29|nr:DNRLRE domain-containing protein [Peribacillus asahii]USK83143.1 DNRLRE domain-containing protein [Peribacillus asahii]
MVNKSDNGYVETEATKLESLFPEKPSKNQPLIYRSGEHELTFGLTYASDGEQKIEPTYSSESEKRDNALTYKSLYPAIDLRHIALNNEVKEDWIMHEYKGINEFHYTIQTDLFGQVKKDGSIGFYEDESKEKQIFTLPKPVMVDSNYNDTLGDGVRSSDIHYELIKKSDTSYELVLVANKSWLSSPKRVFPIYIDPSVSIDVLGDTFVMSAYPNNNYNKEWDASQGEYVLKTGYYDSTTGTNYAFMKFSVIGDLKGATIDSAQLAAYITHSYYATTKTGIWVDEVKGQWYADELTWNNKPSSTNIDSTTAARDEWAYFDVKSTVQAWVNGTRQNYGFKFHTNGNGKTYWKKITSAENTNKAKLVISYHYNQMTNPTVNAYSYGEGQTTGYIDVKWSAKYGATSYDLQMYDGKGYQTIYSGSGTSWSSKGKKIFPKSPYSTSSTYKTDGTGVELSVDPSAFYSAKSGTTNTKKDYGFRVIAKFPNGNSPASTTVYKAIPIIQVGSPEMPTVKAYAYPEDSANKGRGWLDISWKPVANATGYKVFIYNGRTYDAYPVGKSVTSVSTKGKKIWPTDEEIAAGMNTLHSADLSSTGSPSIGAELPIDPGPTYGNNSKRYSVRVKAVTALGDSPYSDVNYGYIPLLSPKNVKVTGDILDSVNNKGKLAVKWDAVEGAGAYQVQINTGEAYKTFTVKGDTNFDTTGISLFDNITDLPADPTNYYSTNTPESLKGKRAYQVRVKAYRFDDDDAPESETEKLEGPRALSVPSEDVYGAIPAQEELLGLEDYFTYGEHQTGNAQTSVNVTTGNIVTEFTDQSLFTRGVLGFDFTRYYNSRSTRSSAFGQGWTFTGNENLVEVYSSSEPSKVTYHDEDGTQHELIYDSTNQKYISPKGKYLTLTKETVNDTQGFILKDKDGFSKLFEIKPGTTDEYRLYAYRDVHQNMIRFFYNQDQLLTEISEVNHNGEKIRTSIQLTYNSDKLINKVEYGEHWTEYEYNNKYLVSTKTKDSRTTESIIEKFSYNSFGQIESYTDGKGNITKYLYDDNELKVFDKQETDAAISVSTTYHYNDEKNEFRVTDTDENTTVYKRDAENDTFAVKEISNSNETTSTVQYDDKYNILHSKDEDGIENSNTYDSKGNLKTHTDANGTTSYEYDDKNRVISSTNPKGIQTINTYEGENLSSTKIGEETTNYEYDSYGRETKVTYPNQTYEETVYDDATDTITVKDAKGQITSTSYDPFGNVKSKTDTEGRRVSYEYHPLHLTVITAVADGKGKTTHYTHDGNGNMTTLTDALGRTKTYEYNDNDQVTKVTLPGMVFTYHYNLNGNMDKEIKPSGNTLSYSYDEMDQIDSTTVSTPSEGEVLQFNQTYTDGGQVESVTYKDLESNQTLLQKDFMYNDLAQLKSYTQGNYTIGYTYDENERPLRSSIDYNQDTDSWKVEQSFQYTDEGKMDRQTVGIGEQHWMIFDYDYDLANNQQKVTVNDNLYQKTNTFNQRNLLESIVYTKGNDTSLRYDYTYDGSGNIKEESNGQSVTSFTYDENSQLTQEVLPDGTINQYDYDDVGNRTESIRGDKTDVFKYNAANQIATKNDIAYQYDTDGNLLQDEHFKYEYNAFGYQTRVTDLQGNEVARYEYDETGLRTKKIIGSKTYEYYYDGNQLSLEVIRNGASIEQYRNYQWDGINPLGMLIRKKDESGIWKEHGYHYWTNHRGDVLSIRDEQGKEIGSYEYDAYGNVLSIDGEVAKENPIRYAGYYYDNETKNYYLQARYYNPVNGTFLALDPHPGDEDEPLSQNGYTYANNNPIMNIDINGQKSVKSYIRNKVKNAPKWVRDGLKKMFPNKKSWVSQQIAVKSVTWGAAGAMTGRIVVKVSLISGKVETIEKWGKIGATGGFIFGSHAGAISAAVPTYARYQIGVYLFGK